MGTGVLPTALEHRLSLAPASGIAKETCRGLKVAHPRGVFPRDLKPVTVGGWQQVLIGPNPGGISKEAS